MLRRQMRTSCSAPLVLLITTFGHVARNKAEVISHLKYAAGCRKGTSGSINERILVNIGNAGQWLEFQMLTHFKAIIRRKKFIKLQMGYILLREYAVSFHIWHKNA